jgi:hypothetical protein
MNPRLVKAQRLMARGKVADDLITLHAQINVKIGKAVEYIMRGAEVPQTVNNCAGAIIKLTEALAERHKDNATDQSSLAE